MMKVSFKGRKQKGNAFERLVARMLSDWWGCEFHRTPMSGAMSMEMREISGDIICEEPGFPFNIECKKREGWDLVELLNLGRKTTKDSPESSSLKGEIISWWNQSSRDALKMGKLPLLVFARNFQLPLVAFPTVLRLGPRDLVSRFDFRLCVDGPGITICLLQDFTYMFDRAYIKGQVDGTRADVTYEMTEKIVDRKRRHQEGEFGSDGFAGRKPKKMVVVKRKAG